VTPHKETFVTAKIRLAAGGTALALGLCALSASTAAPNLPKDTYKRAAEADIAALQKLFVDGKPAKGAAGTIKTLSVMIATYGGATGDAALTAQALKVADAAGKKKWDVAEKEAKLLKVGAGGGGAGKGGLHKSLDLDEIMSPFRIGKSGGLNIEKDLKDAAKAGMIDPKAAEVLGARSAVIAEFTKDFPNDKAKTNAANKKKWEDYCKSMQDLSQQVAAEGAKGNGKIGPLLKKLDATCVNCHNDFRD
jgi:hypothetical protein